MIIIYRPNGAEHANKSWDELRNEGKVLEYSALQLRKCLQMGVSYTIDVIYR